MSRVVGSELEGLRLLTGVPSMGCIDVELLLELSTSEIGTLPGERKRRRDDSQVEEKRRKDAVCGKSRQNEKRRRKGRGKGKEDREKGSKIIKRGEKREIKRERDTPLGVALNTMCIIYCQL